jgi:hypothetical protein
MALYLPNRSIIKDESEMGVVDPDFHARIRLIQFSRSSLKKR